MRRVDRRVLGLARVRSGLVQELALPTPSTMIDPAGSAPEAKDWTLGDAADDPAAGAGRIGGACV